MSGSDRQAERWRLRDVIAFEVASMGDRDRPWSELEARDRRIGEEIGREGLRSFSNQRLLREWLRRVRPKRREEPSEEDIVEGGLSLASKVVFLLGLVVGAGLARELLRYEGTEPVNVSAFFGLLVLLQGCLAVATVLAVSLPLPAGCRLQLSLGYQLLAPLARALARGVTSFAARRVGGERRQAVASLAGGLGGGGVVYGSVIKWYLFRVAQGFGVAFNLGALTVATLAIAFSDIAFGWQSSLPLDAGSLGVWAERIAAPWSWLWGEGVGYPTLSAIEGSRIVLKDGIRSLQSEHLAAWWPFLLLGVVCYGLLPRLLLWGWAAWALRRCLDKLDFRQHAAQSIMDRMRQGVAGFERRDGDVVEGPGVSERLALADAGGTTAVQGGVELALVSESIWEKTGKDEMRQALGPFLPPEESEAAVQVLPSAWLGEPGEAAKALRERDGVGFVFESWMPPLEEIKSILREARGALAKRATIRVWLAGRPREGGLREPKGEEIEIWRRVVRQLGDPYCVVTALPASEAAEAKAGGEPDSK